MKVKKQRKYTVDNHTHEYENKSYGEICKYCLLLRSAIESSSSLVFSSVEDMKKWFEEQVDDDKPKQEMDDWEREFEEKIYIPHEIVDGDSCWNIKKPMYVEDTGGKRIIGYETYPSSECACGITEVKQDIKQFIKSNFISKKELREVIEKKKYKNPEPLGNNDSYNHALEDVLELLE